MGMASMKDGRGRRWISDFGLPRNSFGSVLAAGTFGRSRGGRSLPRASIFAIDTDEETGIEFFRDHGSLCSALAFNDRLVPPQKTVQRKKTKNNSFARCPWLIGMHCSYTHVE